MSLCKPDSSWIKYRHQGLAHRQVCCIRSYQDLCAENAPLIAKLCAEKWLWLLSLLRLIQFPPPPLKGGITVTMEDLQCLDSGQFLNDVIIDFYLKLVTSSQTLERCINRGEPVLKLCRCVTVNQIPPPQSCYSCDRALPHLQQFLLQAADAEGQRQRRQHQGLVSNHGSSGTVFHTVRANAQVVFCEAIVNVL